MMRPDDAPDDGVQPLPQFSPPHVRDAFAPFPSTLVVDKVLGCGVVEEMLGSGVVEEMLGEDEHEILSFVYSPT